MEFVAADEDNLRSKNRNLVTGKHAKCPRPRAMQSAEKPRERGRAIPQFQTAW